MEKATLFDKPKLSDCELYDRKHPEIWREFVKLTLQLVNQGVRHYGAKAIVEVIRFHRIIHKDDKDEYKINNNITAYYARKFHRNFPQFDGFFETRKSKIKV